MKLRKVLLNNRYKDIFIYILQNNKVITLAHGYGEELYDMLGTVFIDCNVKTINKKINCLEIELDYTMIVMKVKNER